MAIALSHGGTTSYTSPSPSNQVLVGTVEGVLSIERNEDGSGWHVAHRGLPDKHIHAVIVEPDKGTIFAGATSEGSLYASADGGYTWDRRDNGLTQQDIYSLSWVRLNGRVRIFVGTEPAHLFYSDDLGFNWQELEALRSVDMSRWCFPAPPFIAHTKHINFHPSDPRTLFVSVEHGGLLKSSDGGETFHVMPGMDDDVHRTVINPEDPDRIYVTGRDGMYVTSDGGGSWEHWTSREAEIGGYPDMLVIHPRQPDLMFIAAARNDPGYWTKTQYAGSKISRSRDGGRTWEPMHDGLPDQLQTSFGAMCLEDWGQSFSLFGATASGDVWCSDDGGEHWSQVIAGIPPISKGGHHKLLVKA